MAPPPPPPPPPHAVNPPVRLPPGFRFKPTEQELVEHYLIKRALGHSFPANLVEILNVYRLDPEDLSYTTRGLERWGYFFVEDCDEKCRNPFGYWEPQGCETPVQVGEEIVAYKKKMIFFNPLGVESCWRMLRYRLDQDLFRMKKDTNAAIIDNVVVCKVYNASHEIDQYDEMINDLEKVPRRKK